MKTGSLESRLKILRPTRKSTNHIVTKQEKQGRVSHGGDVGDVPRTGNVCKCTVPGKPCCGAIYVHVVGTNRRCDLPGTEKVRSSVLIGLDTDNVLTGDLLLLLHTWQVEKVVQRNCIYN